MPADQKRRIGGFSAGDSPFIWTTASQVASSSGNALFILGTARSFGGAEFFDVGVLATIHATSLGFLRASVGDRLLATEGSPRRSEFALTLSISGLIGGVVFVVGLLTASAVFTIAGVAMPILLLQDTFRYRLFRLGRAPLAAVGDALWAIIVVVGLVLLMRVDADPVHYVATWVLGSLLSLLLMERSASLRPWVRPGFRFLSDTSAPLRFYLGDWLIGSGAILVLVHFLSALESESDSSGFRLAWTIYGVAGVVHLAAIVVSTINWAAGQRRLALIVVPSLCVMATSVAIAVLAAVTPDDLATRAFGQQWHDTKLYIYALFPLFLGMGVSSGAIGALRGTARADSALRVRVVSFTLGATALLIGRLFLDLRDALTIGGLTIAVANIGYWREVIRARAIADG